MASKGWDDSKAFTRRIATVLAAVVVAAVVFGLVLKAFVQGRPRAEVVPVQTSDGIDFVLQCTYRTLWSQNRIAIGVPVSDAAELKGRTCPSLAEAQAAGGMKSLAK